MLDCEQLHVKYGRILALQGVSVSIGEGEIVSVLGANGAGKTTLLRAISGLERSASGSVKFADVDITSLHPSKIARSGIALVPAGRQLFGSFSVKENLLLGAEFRGRSIKASSRLNYVYELFPILATRASQVARTLSGGEQQMLAIGRAMMGEPRLLMLDEPSLGLAPRVLEQILRTIHALNKADGLTVLIVEQNAHFALDFAHRAVILANGRLIEEATTSSLRKRKDISQLYFGV